jgi:hypothetical protein
VGSVSVAYASQIQEIHLVAVSDSSHVTVMIHSRAIDNNSYIVRKPQKVVPDGSAYFLSFVYKPTLPVGKETSTILVKLPNGKTIATVRIIANKTDQFVPDI